MVVLGSYHKNITAESIILCLDLLVESSCSLQLWEASWSGDADPSVMLAPGLLVLVSVTNKVVACFVPMMVCGFHFLCDPVQMTNSHYYGNSGINNRYMQTRIPFSIAEQTKTVVL